MSALIHLAEVFVFLLFIITFVRIRSLYRDYPPLNHTKKMTQTDERKPLVGNASASVKYEDKMAILKEAQVFAGMQLLPLKKRYGDIHGEKYAWLRKACAFYLIGATRPITNTGQCGPGTYEEITGLVIKSCLKTPNNDVLAYLKSASNDEWDKEQKVLALTGEQAAANWVSGKAIPHHTTLDEHLSRNGIIA